MSYDGNLWDSSVRDLGLGTFFLCVEQDSSGTTLMDLITSDPTAAKQGGASAAGNKAPSPGRAASQPTALGKPATDRKSKKATLLQIQNDTISAAKAVRTNIMPHRSKKKVCAF